jgi:hypothetical protein
MAVNLKPLNGRLSAPEHLPASFDQNTHGYPLMVVVRRIVRELRHAMGLNGDDSSL